MTTETKLHPFRAWRLLAELTLEDCAKALGVTFQHLGHVERGQRNPSVGLIKKMETFSRGAVSQEEVLRFATGKIA